MASELGVQTLQHTNGTTAATIDSDGEVAFSQPFAVNPKLIGSAVSLSGLAHKDFTIPSGTNRFTVTLNNVSGPENGYLRTRLGTSSGIISSTSYTTHNANGSDTNSFSGYGGSSGGISLSAWSSNLAKLTGTMQWTHFGGNFWYMDAPIVAPDYAAYFISYRGAISLGAELTTVRIFPATGTFDDGTANLLLG